MALTKGVPPLVDRGEWLDAKRRFRIACTNRGRGAHQSLLPSAPLARFTIVVTARSFASPSTREL
jgi:hypothetical protein